jgi:hypothetical protein
LGERVDLVIPRPVVGSAKVFGRTRRLKRPRKALKEQNLDVMNNESQA